MPAVCAACLVKQFLRELPDPLLTRPLSPLFVAAGRTEDARERRANLRLLLRGLPALNRRVLRELVAFLQLVAAHSAHNRMTPANLGIVFAPTLLYTDVAAPDASALADAGVANDVVETLITHYADLLPDDPLPLTPPRTPPSAATPLAVTPLVLTPEPNRKKSRASDPSDVAASAAPGHGGSPSGDGDANSKETETKGKEEEKEADDHEEEHSSGDDDEKEKDEGEDEEEEDGEEDENKNIPTKEMLEAYLTAIREWEAKKERVKEDLVAYDAAFAREHGGRLPTAAEKEPMRERYAQYRSIKSAVETLRAEYERGLALYRAASASPAAGVDDILPHPYAGLTPAELNRALVRLATEKRALRTVLSRWSHDFAARHHRPPAGAVDYAPVQDEFTRYCRNKETAAMIRRYLEAHGHKPSVP